MKKFLNSHYSQNSKNLSTEKKRILVIDDNIEILELNSEILKMSDYEVFTAQSGEEAFDILNTTNQFNLILLDFQMKGMSGLEFLLELEKKHSSVLERTPVIFLTGMNEIPLYKAAGFMRKPFTIDQLLNTVQLFIARGERQSTHD